MDEVITRAEHEEFCRRIDEENRRQNRRIELLEEGEQRIATLTASVERLATSMESMLKEQERQGKRLETLESRDGEMWRKVVGYAVTFMVGAVLAFLFAQMGL
jgi:TolA-binding protein